MGKLDAIKQGMSLLTYKVPKGKINPKNMGYVLSDGTINFGSEEAAKSYAKNRIMSALKAKEPFERGVYVNKNRIWGEFDGDRHSVTMHPRNIPKHTMSFHGHPTKSQPLSLTDYLTLRNNPNLDSIHAYDANGEISSFYKTNNKKKIPDTIEMLFWLLDEYVEKQFDRAIFINPFKKEIKKASKIPNEINKDAMFKELYHYAQTSPKGQLRIHRFWQNHAKELGVRYETNYTGFPPKEVSLAERIINTLKNLFSKSE